MTAIAIITLYIYHKIIQMIILISISIYYAFATILISNDSIYNNNNRMTRILNYVNNSIETVADSIGKSIRIK